MSAYSDWKCGALEDWQYRAECEDEARRDDARWEDELGYEEEDDGEND